jgi:hypothetical protein
LPIGLTAKPQIDADESRCQRPCSGFRLLRSRSLFSEQNPARAKRGSGYLLLPLICAHLCPSVVGLSWAGFGWPGVKAGSDDGRPGPGSAQAVVSAGSLRQPAEPTWAHPACLVHFSLWRQTDRSGMGAKRKLNVSPWHLHGSEPCQSYASAVYKGCTPEVHRRYTGCSCLRSLYIRCTSGVPPVYTARRGGSHLVARRIHSGEGRV